MELKKNKNQETDGYGRDKRPYTEKLKRKEIALTEKLEKKLKQRKKRKAVRVSVKSVRRGARCLWRVGFEK